MLKFYIPDHDEFFQHARLVPECQENNPNRFAVKAAEWVHSQESGWDCTWPMVFAVVDEAGKEARFTVERDFEPQFFVVK